MRPHYFVCLLFAALLMAGCNSKPDDVLGEGKTVSLLADMQVADAITKTNLQFASDSAKKVLRQSVFDKNGVTEQQYIATVNWYGHHLDDYAKVLEKVDKRLAKMQKSIGEGTAAETGSTSSLWPYGQMALISDLGLNSMLKYDLANQELAPGTLLTWNLRMNKQTAVTVVMGADYTDGTSEVKTEEVYGRKKVSINFQTDSARTVRRVFGSLTLSDPSVLPLWIDSIQIVQKPFAKEDYRMNSQSQITFDEKLLPKRLPKPIVKKDDDTQIPDKKAENQALRRIPVAPRGGI